MQISDDRSVLLVAAGFALIVIGEVLNLIAVGWGSDGYFIVFPFGVGLGDSSILIGVFLVIITLIFVGLSARWALTMPEKQMNRTTMDSDLRVCGSCQRAVQADAAYCPYCGTPLDAD